MKGADDLSNRGEALYERYARPLETEHGGEFVAVSLDGRMVLGQELRTLVQEARAKLGPGIYVFKIGERAVGNWR